MVQRMEGGTSDKDRQISKQFIVSIFPDRFV